ncbi:MAG: type II toxin-antitoxin system Phd/YefM family antitoxin [SAR202 cluster bacterium]|nr:type II toxin-antitoxin system Phd/YefM family antitoxin [SAR202 cluster bacterium]
MTKKVSAAKAKAHFSELTANVARTGQRVIIERRGKPVAAIVSIGDLECLEREQRLSEEPVGALALVGAWSDLMTDEEIDQFIKDIYESRERDFGRPVELEP